MSNFSTPIITSNNTVQNSSNNTMLAINNNDNQRDLINLESNHNLNEINFSSAPVILVSNNQNNLSYNANDQYSQPPSQPQFLPPSQQHPPVIAQAPFQALPAVGETGDNYQPTFNNFAPPLHTKANSIPSIPMSPPANSLQLPIPPPMPINTTNAANDFSQYQFSKSPFQSQYNDANLPNQLAKPPFPNNMSMPPDSIPFNNYNQHSNQQAHNPEMEFNPPVYTTANNSLLPPLTNPSTPGMHHENNNLSYSMMSANNLDIPHHGSNLNQLGGSHASIFSVSSTASSSFSSMAPPSSSQSVGGSEGSSDISASYPPMNPNFIYSFPNQAMRVNSTPNTPSNLGLNSVKKKRRQTATMYDMTPETAARNRCSICNKQFKRPSSLQTHLYSHTGEKLFRCPWPECGRYFSVKSNMTRHARLHERDLLKKQQELQNHQL